jgi:Homeodomain-like domain
MATPNLYAVQLKDDQRQQLLHITHNGHAPAKKILHARVLLLADKAHPEGRWGDAHIAAALNLHVNSVARIRKLFVLQGAQPALERQPRTTPPVAPKIDGRVEAHLVALCCAPAPAGHARWTLSLLVQELTRGRFVTTVCRETVRRALKKTNCNLGASNVGASRKRTGRAS